MKTILIAFATIAALGGTAYAQDAMSSPMQGDAMSGEMMMTPAQMMAMCLDKAAMAADAMAQEEGTKACNTVQTLLMGEAMMSTPMSGDAMAPGAMAGDAMAPAQ
jgi:hypothetical protein